MFPLKQCVRGDVQSACKELTDFYAEEVSFFTIHPQIARITQIFFSFFVSKKNIFCVICIICG